MLEGCLANAFQTFGGKDLYKTLVDKAAIIFYTMIKDHPFMNGNKRIAVTSLLVFLALNGKWLKATNEALYEMAIDIAAEPIRLASGVCWMMIRHHSEGRAVRNGVKITQ